NDLLTPGMVESDDPPPVLSGMIQVDLDAQGRLVYFEAVPPQLRESAKAGAAAVDWGPLFAAAALDPAKFQATGASLDISRGVRYAQGVDGSLAGNVPPAAY